MFKLSAKFTIYVIAFMLISGVCALVYGTTQNSLRRSADNPQIQLARDTAAALASGTQPELIAKQIDLEKSLASFIAVYDKAGNPISSNGILYGVMPMPPKGLFDWVHKFGEHHVSWQTKTDLRFALILVPVPDNSGRVVASGRNLLEVEKLERRIFMESAIAWLFLMTVAWTGIFVLTQAK
ncbi:MAG: hypothetical protein KW802_02170 [Candidatus Doudnabacteria bacterium]|nr:hypothetical protein [Candidatus Doudnabacteria bacterium]